jgi:hypothetical protein
VASNTTLSSLDQQRNLSETTVYKVKVSEHFIFPQGIVSFSWTIGPVNALGLSPKLFIPDNVYFVAVLT